LWAKAWLLKTEPIEIGRLKPHGIEANAKLVSLLGIGQLASKAEKAKKHCTAN